MICVLIQAGEGNTQLVFVGDSKESLIKDINAHYDHWVETEDNKEYLAANLKYYMEERDDFLAMVGNHVQWTAGRYDLELPEYNSVWEECTLIIR